MTSYYGIIGIECNEKDAKAAKSAVHIKKYIHFKISYSDIKYNINKYI